VQRALLEAGVVLSLSDYSDVPSRHKFYKAVQIAGLYRLVKPVVPPHPERRARGVFGVDKPVTRDEMAAMMNKARTASGTHAGENMPESDGGKTPVTRAAFLETVLRAFGIEEDHAKGSAADLNRPITRGEAAEVLMRAMTGKM
jgi:hypothetical protein